MKKINLARTGNRELSFEGELLATASSHSSGKGPLSTRSHMLELYQTADSRYVLTICWQTRWQGESEHYEALVCENAGSVAKTLRAYDPGKHLKWRHIEKSIRVGFEEAATELLLKLEPEELTQPPPDNSEKETIANLKALSDDDHVIAHNCADNFLLEFLRGKGFEAVVEAYEEVAERIDFRCG